MEGVITARIEEWRRGRIKIFPVHTNRASELGHECERYLVLNRTRWQEKQTHDVGLQTIFDEGRMHELEVLRILREAGIEVIEQQRPFSWAEHQITGSIDGKIVIDGKAVPLEVKSISSWGWDAISTIEDMHRSAKPWIRRYPAQMTIYLLLNEGEERGVFLFKNKQTGAIKEVWCPLDYALGEVLIQKADRINDHVRTGTLPPPITYDEDTCGSCGYLHVCLPDVKRDAIVLADNPELAAKLNRRAELSPVAREYELLDREIKEAVKGQTKVLVGDWLITGHEVVRQEKAREARETRFWQTKIQRLGTGTTQEAT